MHAALMANRFCDNPLIVGNYYFCATPALGPGRDIQLPPGNFPNPPRAKCRFGAAAGPLNYGALLHNQRGKAHVMDNSDTRRSVHRPRDQRVSSGRVLIVASKVPRSWHMKIELRFSPRSRFGRRKPHLPGRVCGENSNAAALLNGARPLPDDE
jgi:hypothetical protein